MYPNLNAEMARHNIKQSNIANALNIKKATVSDKVNNKTSFKIDECKEIKKSFFPNLSLEYLFATKDEIGE